MDLLDSAKELRDAGRYREALEALEALGGSVTRTPFVVLKAEILERCGQHRQALRLAESVLRAKDSGFADRASCERAVGRILWEQGDLDGALEHLQRTVA